MRTFRRKREHSEDLDVFFSCKSYSVSKCVILVLLLKHISLGNEYITIIRSVMITKQVFFDDNLSETENIFGKEWITEEDRSRSFLNEFNKAKF